MLVSYRMSIFFCTYFMDKCVFRQIEFPRDVQWPEMPAVLSAKKSKLGLAKVGI